MDAETLGRHITHVHPELAGAPMRVMNEGFDSVAVVVGDRVFKFPRDEEARSQLVREQAVLAAIRPHVSMRVPELVLHDGPPLFSEHVLIPGEHLTTAAYARLSHAARADLAEEMGRLYAELHALPRKTFAALPAATFGGEATPDEVERDLVAVLPDDLWPFARATLAAWRVMGADPLGETFGYFDGHGWNMAFDHERVVLNGVFDFADARVGPVHRELVYSSFIDRDLTRRIIDVYESLTRRTIDRARVELLFSVLLISEVAGHEQYPDRLPHILSLVRAWVGAPAHFGL